MQVRSNADCSVVLLTCINTFAAKHDCSRMSRSLPNATTVKGTIDSRYKGRKLLLFISNRSGDIIISHMEVSAIFCTRMDFTNMFEISLDLAEIKNIENMSMGMTYRTH